MTSGTWHWVSIRVNRKLIQPYQNNSAVLRKQKHCGKILENIGFRKSIASDFDIFSQVILGLSQVCGLYSDSWHQKTSLQFHPTWVQKNRTTPKYSKTICYPNVHDLETQEKKHQLGHQLWAYGYFLSKNTSVWWFFDSPLGRNPAEPPTEPQHLLRVEGIFLRHAHAECRDLASDKLLNDHSDDTH